MIDRELLTYDHDEEALGFEPPPVAVPQPISLLTKLSVAGTALGTLLLLVSLSAPSAIAGWPALVASFGLISVAGALYFWLAYRGSTPGIRNDGIYFRSLLNRGALGWGLGVLLTGFYVVLYWMPEYLERAVRLTDPLSEWLARQPADQWFLYGMLYTLAVLVMGVRMLMRYRHNRYQQIRTLSVMFFQFGLAFVLPNLLKALNEPEFYFTYFWPLKPEYLWPGQWGFGWILDGGRLGVFMVFWGAVLSFVATPVLTYLYGKRWYCSWVCGCGGLAETLGDPFRQLSSKSTSSWKVERAIIYSVLLLVVFTTAVLWANHDSAGAAFAGVSGPLKRWYGFVIGALFSGVIGVGFYPILGSRVWCRFGCPMAAVLGIWQKFLSRFRITTNYGQCMSCGNCSTYCEMGIDVRAYAQRGENIVRASCVGCGVCAAVCPRGVLRLENDSDVGGRFPGADRPLDALFDVVKTPPNPGVYGSRGRNRLID